MALALGTLVSGLASHLHRGFAAASLARLPDVDDLAPDAKGLVWRSRLLVAHLRAVHVLKNSCMRGRNREHNNTSAEAPHRGNKYQQACCDRCF